MKTKLITRGDRSATAFMPEREDIVNLRVGDMAPDCWGKMSKVVEISFVGETCKGMPFVHFYTELSATSRVSGSMVVGIVQRSMHLTGLLNSAECDAVEQEMRVA